MAAPKSVTTPPEKEDEIVKAVHEGHKTLGKIKEYLNWPNYNGLRSLLTRLSESGRIVRLYDTNLRQNVYYPVVDTAHDPIHNWLYRLKFKHVA